MSFPKNHRAKSRLIVAWLTALSIIGPVLGSATTTRADDNALTNDARMEAYPNGKGVYADGGSGKYYMLMVGLLVLGVSVMFKNAKRMHTK